MLSVRLKPASFDLTPSSSSLAFGLLLPNSTIGSVSQLTGAAGADGLVSAGATPKVGLTMRMMRSPRPESFDQYSPVCLRRKGLGPRQPGGSVEIHDETPV